jgi:hypothetical protein
MKSTFPFFLTLLLASLTTLSAAESSRSSTVTSS